MSSSQDSSVISTRTPTPDAPDAVREIIAPLGSSRTYAAPRSRRRKKKAGSSVSLDTTTTTSVPTQTVTALSSLDKSSSVTLDNNITSSTPTDTALSLKQHSSTWIHALAARLSHRPLPAELERSNVLRGSGSSANSIRAAQDTALHLLARTSLARSLRDRTSREELESAGILRDRGPSLVAAAAHTIAALLRNRPSVRELVVERELLKKSLMLWAALELPTAAPGASVPAPRHCATLSLVGRALFLLGGLTEGGSEAPLDPLILLLDASRWAAPHKPLVSPIPRYAHTATTVGRFIALFGGYGARAWLNDVWILDTDATGAGAGLVVGSCDKELLAELAEEAMNSTSTATQTSVSVTASSSSSSSTAIGNVNVGSQTNSLAWHCPVLAAGSSPAARAAHSTVLIVSPARNISSPSLLVFGGSDGSQLFNDLWALPLGVTAGEGGGGLPAWVRLNPAGSPPSPRSGHTALVIGTNVLVFGGGEGWGNDSFADLFLLELRGMQWVRPATTGQPPPARSGHSAVVVGGGAGVGRAPPPSMLVFGGSNARRALNDVYVLCSRSFHWSRPSESGMMPSPRSGAATATVGAFFVVFGGCGVVSNIPFGDTFVCDTEFRRYADDDADEDISTVAPLSSILPLPPSLPPPPISATALAAAALKKKQVALLASPLPRSPPRTPTRLMPERPNTSTISSFSSILPTVVPQPINTTATATTATATATVGSDAERRFSWPSRLMSTSALAAALDLASSSSSVSSPTRVIRGSNTAAAAVAPVASVVERVIPTTTAQLPSLPLPTTTTTTTMVPTPTPLRVVGSVAVAAATASAQSLAAEALSVSSSSELVALLQTEVLRRRAEDDDRYALVLEQLSAWREERQLETAVLLDALAQLSAVGE